jgi:hypothetical protein
MTLVNVVLLVFIAIGLSLAIFARPIARRLNKAAKYGERILLQFYPDKEFLQARIDWRKKFERPEGSFGWELFLWIWRCITLAFAGVALYLLIKFN